MCISISIFICSLNKMNAKRVSFSDNTDVFTIPRVDGAKRLSRCERGSKVIYSCEELRSQIVIREEAAIRRAKREYVELEKRCKELCEYIQTIDEDNDDEYQDFYEMIEENFFEQSILTRKLIALLIAK